MGKPKLVTANAITIDKGVKRPPLRSKRRIYPWNEMEVGDSFLMPAGLAPNAAYGCARDQNTEEILKGSPKRFRGGRSDDGFRVWRVE